MTSIQRIVFCGGTTTQLLSEYIGQKGEFLLDPVTGNIFWQNGETPGGIAIGGGLEITDGVTDLNGVNKITITGGTVGGTAPNATLTINGNTTQDITTGSTPTDLTTPYANVYIITTGGTKGIETVSLPGYESYADSQVGQQVEFWWVHNLQDGSNPTISYTDQYGGTSTINMNPLGADQASDEEPYKVLLECNGQNWLPVSAPVGRATASGGNVTLHNPSGTITSDTLGEGVTSYTFILTNSTLGYYRNRLQLTLVSSVAAADSTVQGPWLMNQVPNTNGQIEISIGFPSTTGGNLTIDYEIKGN